MSTPQQKEIFTRLHALFTETNNELATTKNAHVRLQEEHNRLKATFDEQNETLRRYEETFGILPVEQFAARSPFELPAAPYSGMAMPAVPPAAPFHGRDATPPVAPSAPPWAKTPSFPPMPTAPNQVDVLLADPLTLSQQDDMNQRLISAFGERIGRWMFLRLLYGARK